ncbi:MAG: histidinol dehydrogenase, partial [Amphiplicatus sp.]
MVKRLNSKDATFDADFTALVDTAREDAADVSAVVAAIVADVRKRGFAALAGYTQKFDRFELTEKTLVISAAEIDAAEAACDAEALTALDLAAARIRAYHERQRPEDLRYTDDQGVTLGWRWTPVDAAGLYAPGGRAAYPSSVLMNAIPAKVAGARRLSLCVPTPDGAINPLVLAAAKRAGVDEIFRVGGAQA